MRSYSETENEADANLFKLYYFFAFKGTRQLNWSKGLKSWLAKLKKNRSEIVDDTDNVAELLFKLDIEMWHAVRKQKNRVNYWLLLQKIRLSKTDGINTAMFGRSRSIEGII